MPADLVESLELTIVETTNRTSKNGKAYVSVKDDRGNYYSIWDSANAAMVVVGTPMWWSVETKGNFHNIVGRALAPDGNLSAPAAATPTTPTPSPSISQTPAPQVRRNTAISADIDLRKHAAYLATLMYGKEPMTWDQYYIAADKILAYLVLSPQTAAAPVPAAGSPVNNDLVPERFIAS